MNNYLYKYVSIDALKKIIENKVFMCKSPALFNDPFDTCVENLFLSVGETATNILSTLCKGWQDLAASEREDIQGEVVETVIATRKNKPEYENVTNSILRSAIFCLSRTPNNILMWSHYSNQHLGAVIEIDLERAKQNDSWIAAVKPVEYSNELSSLTYLNIIYTKAKMWGYEEEWRVHIADEFLESTPLNERQRLLKFNQSEITSIIFGLKTTNKEIQDIKCLINRHDFNAVDLYQMSRIPGRFEIKKNLI